MKNSDKPKLKILNKLYKKIANSKLNDIHSLNELIETTEGFNPNNCTTKGIPLICKVMYNVWNDDKDKVKILELLIAHNLNVNSIYDALHIAAQSGYYEVAKLLVDHGANVYAIYDEKTPIDLATEEDDDMMLSILKTKQNEPTNSSDILVTSKDKDDNSDELLFTFWNESSDSSDIDSLGNELN